MKILTYPNELLKVVCKSVEKITPELQDIAKQMYKIMIEAKGIGLASNQVGLDIKLIVLDQTGQPIYMFNPVIVSRSKDTVYETEGCLSFPGDWRKIKRNKTVKVKYRDINNKMQYIELTGILSIAMQHEFDHLQGKLFIEYEEKN